IKNTKINFIGFRKVTYFLSILLVLNGLFSVWKVATGRANMGLDFTGGTSLQLQFSKDITVEHLRNVMSDAGFKSANIQQVAPASANTFLIRVGSQELKTEEASSGITDLIRKETGDQGIKVLEQNDIGGTVSQQLKSKAFQAVFWACIGILVYIWIRFKFKFAVVATLATAHDVLAVLGFMVILNKEIDLLMITALLTVAGYSLTDTVVVFDRIRENMRNILKNTFEEIVNKAINDVLARTLMTSITTLLVAVSLFVFGGNVLHTFSLAIIMGVCVGTYSSDLLAAPLIVDWENWEKKNKALNK
ncbi:MAG: protein translocase subunit SecF, partial [Spirochaetia bacterium]|nr:protein translocase subunit SecF [Spirochaetia bacterium]